MKILFKYATRSRRDNFLRGIESITRNISDEKNYHILIAVDADDDKMKPVPVLNCPHTYIVGSSENKVHAINRGVNEFDYEWDILACMSDDMVFTERQFDDVIREHSNGLDTDFFIHFPDGNRKDLCTMSIVGRDYYNRDQYIYNPKYSSLYCDNEAQLVAEIRGCYKFVNKKIFEHLHPAYGKAVFDQQYQYTESFGSADQAIFEKRKEMNFDL